MDPALPFWFSPPDYPGSNPGPATPQDVAATEAHLGHRLPHELRELLMLQDGGVSSYSSFQDGERRFPLPSFFGARGTGAGSLRYARDYKDDEEIPEDIIVIAAGGHEWLGLDYRSSPHEPAVVFRQDGDAEIEYVVSSFRAFLAGLVEE